MKFMHQLGVPEVELVVLGLVAVVVVEMVEVKRM
jgi:hypothetical protein